VRPPFPTASLNNPTNPPPSWTIRTNSGPYGEIDILESFSDNTQNFVTLHTAGQCTFQAPANTQKGTPNENDFDCNLDGPGCSVKGVQGSYGDPFNKAGGGVYAMQWTSSFIKIFFFPRNAIPADITAGNPDPTKWGLPNANFESQYGSCDIDGNFPAQTIVSNTLFSAPFSSLFQDCFSPNTCHDLIQTQTTIPFAIIRQSDSLTDVRCSTTRSAAEMLEATPGPHGQTVQPRQKYRLVRRSSEQRLMRLTRRIGL
jgi:hypothetical protein